MMTYLVVAFSILAQGLSMKRLLRLYIVADRGKG
jgi:NhaP-type Na+/H+ or K+/H+ antiporter